jgi:hypothetical protein
MATRKSSITGVSIWMKKTRFVVTYQNAFGFSPREEKTFEEESEAKWFERAMKRSNYITSLLEVKE